MAANQQVDCNRYCDAECNGHGWGSEAAEAYRQYQREEYRQAQILIQEEYERTYGRS